MATVAVYSLKGGVGKTTLAVNLAWCAATLSARRTLLWDLDPQAASTWLLGERARGPAQALFSRDADPVKRARPAGIARLDMIAADPSLRALDQLFHDIAKKKRLGKLIAALPGYDRVVLDCPPGLTETADQVIRAADLLVVPVIPSPLSERAFEDVSRHVGDRTPILPVHMMVDRRRRLHADALARQPDWPAIPMASAIEAMTVRREPVGQSAPRSTAAKAFAEVWRRIERQLAS